MKQRDRNRQGQYSLRENAPSGMFSPTRPSSHYLLIRTSTLGILSEVSALVIQLLSMITFTNWASGLKNTSYLNHCSWQGGMVLPIGKRICFLIHSVHTGLLALVKRPRAGMCRLWASAHYSSWPWHNKLLQISLLQKGGHMAQAPTSLLPLDRQQPDVSK